MKNTIILIIKNFWGGILFLIVLLYLYLKPETKELIVVNSENHITVNVTEDDPRVTDIWIKGENFILNNTDKNLILESLSYYTNSFSSYKPKKINIKPGINPVDVKVDFMFSTPPESIKVKSGSSTTRWYLHR
tara:strand:- start:463 stop:861 length:399 start_codon:yes stop_codon:yes gene_type:complete